MKTQSPDTSAEAEAVQIALLRQASPARRVRMVVDLNRMVWSLALNGLRKMHPELAAAEIRLLLAERLLGDTLARQVYTDPSLGYVRSEDRRMDDDSLAALLRVIEQLDALGIPYLLGGSLASSIHGLPRTTIDADLVAEIPETAVQTLVERLSPFYYINADAVHEAIRNRRSFNLIHLASMFKIDVFLPRRRAFEQSQMARRHAEILREDPERTALVATPEDTILANWSGTARVARSLTASGTICSACSKCRAPHWICSTSGHGPPTWACRICWSVLSMMPAWPDTYRSHCCRPDRKNTGWRRAAPS